MSEKRKLFKVVLTYCFIMVSKVKEKAWYKKWWTILIFIFIGLVIIGSFLPDNPSNKTIYVCPDGSHVSNSNQCSSVTAQTQDNSQTKVCTQDWQCTLWSECSASGQQTRNCTLVTNSCDETPKDKPTESQSCTPTTPAVEGKSDKATIGEKNALSKALNYLSFMPFSYSGLIKQLEYEKFTHQEAVYGVDNCGANWNEQAALKAKSYLDMMAFSRDGLITQLEYEGFTKAQAEYGVQAVGY